MKNLLLIRDRESKMIEFSSLLSVSWHLFVYSEQFIATQREGIFPKLLFWEEQQEYVEENAVSFCVLPTANTALDFPRSHPTVRPWSLILESENMTSEVWVLNKSLTREWLSSMVETGLPSGSDSKEYACNAGD